MKNKNHRFIVGVVSLLMMFVLGAHFENVSAASKIPYKGKSAKHAVVKKTSPQGTWHVVAVYNGPGRDGPFTLNNNLNSGNDLKITFKKDSYCRSDYKDPMDDTKPYCEPITQKKDGTITGSRLEAFNGFMKLNGSRLEFIEGGMGYTKYVLEKVK